MLADWVCTKCGFQCEQSWKGNETPPLELQYCDRCASHTLQRQYTSHATPHQNFHTPIEMDSVAPTSHIGIQELRRKIPDSVKMSLDRRDPLYGVPVVKNRSEKLAVLKAAGFVERN
jgi:hypothetical protein